MSEPNLVPYYSRLSQKEKAILLYLLNNSIPEGRRVVEHATLPFVPVKELISVLRSVAFIGGDAGIAKYSRPAKEILVKLAEAMPKGETATKFLMHLEPKKVFKHFGKKAHIGKPLPFLNKVQVTAGMKWSLPKQAWLPDDKVFVPPCVAVRHIAQGLYEVSVAPACRYAVELWLMDNCR